MKWESLVRLGKYFGVIDKEDADIFVEPDHEVFEFDVDENGRLWVSSSHESTSKKNKPSN
tara:strand:- start:2047 stop:2226 length:180 start_codon:yes stop_codon:yes gene_type:complete